MRKYCVMFAGQSVQEEGMCRELWKLKPAREILERLKPSLGEDLEYITTGMPADQLALTFNAQRAIHAHHLGHWFAFKALHPELELDGAIGHSMGVVAALVAAEAMSVEDSGAFIRARAQAFYDICKGFSEPMGLAAVSTDFLEDAVARIESVPGVSLALHNTIGRGTAGGRMADLEALASKIEQEGWSIKLKILRVEGPYHTAAFSPCKPALAKALERVAIQAPRVPVFMGSSGKAETEPARIRELLVRQADALERHFEAVWAAYDHGCRHFLEVAHKPQPVKWIPDQLQDEDGNVLADTTALALETAQLDSPLPL
ncbi:MAG: ACP S-malonyltransferase [Elusimicrobia bacterium]|nr:ACP S-malonyltransferase [Elusimicrobiota bacterium]